MKKEFEPNQEIERNKQLAKELKEKDPFVYNLVRRAQFSSIEKLNNLLEKLIYQLTDIEESFATLATNPKAYNKAVEKYGKVLDGFTNYLGRSIERQETITQ